MNKLVAVLCLGLFATCSTRPKKTKSPFFEGFVEGTINVQSGSADMDSFLYRKYGRYATTYIKDSFVARVYYNNARVIVGREFIRTDSLKLYQVDESSDTMTVTDLTNDYYFSNISTKEVEGKRILGKNCIGLFTINKFIPTIMSDAYTGSALYYLDTTLHICPSFSHHIRYGSYDKVFDKYSYVTLGYDQQFEGIKISMTANRVVQTTVSPIYFEVPLNKIVVNPFLK